MQTTKDQINSNYKKKNIKLFPIYKTFAWDLLFFFPIIFLFLTQVKGFSPAQILLSDSFYTLSNIFWQIPITNIVTRIGKRNALIVGNILFSLAIFSMIFLQNFYELLIIQFIYSLAYSIKGICETNILYDSLPEGRKQGNIFSKIDGKSISYFYVFDAIASIIAGYTFIINGYIPIVLCFICCVISTMLSFKFKHTNTIEKTNKKIKINSYFKQLKDSFSYLTKSKRLKYLIVFNAVFMGLLYGIVSLRSSMLYELKVPDEYFGIIFAILQFVAAIASRRTEQIQTHFKNRTLTYLSIPITFSCIFIGFFGLNSHFNLSFILIFLLYLIQFAIKGPYQVLMVRYLNNFTNVNIRTKIIALKNLTANLFSAIISFSCAMFLNFTSTANVFIIVGCITTMLIVLLLDYMRDKVGVKTIQ